MNFYEDMERGISATEIMKQALMLMEDEMNHPEDSLSPAMYEYACNVDSNIMLHFNQIGEKNGKTSSTMVFNGENFTM